MSAPLHLFPARIRWCNPDGTLTAEAARTLQAMSERLGGVLGDAGADVFAAPQPEAAGAAELIAQPAETPPAAQDVTVQQTPADPGTAEMIMQPPPVTADQVTGLGTMAVQNVGTNFSGSLTGKTVTVANGIITAVA